MDNISVMMWVEFGFKNEKERENQRIDETNNKGYERVYNIEDENDKEPEKEHNNNQETFELE